MIARTWRGWTMARDVEPYVEYLRETGVKELRRTPGNRGVFVFTRIDGDRAEFQVISFWESMDAVRAFAGDDERVAVFYPERRPVPRRSRAPRGPLRRGGRGAGANVGCFQWTSTRR